MIYDCFTFFNDLDVLELRLNILDEIVDKFVIVEARKTHTNLDKPLYFLDNKERYAKFSDKIIHIIADDMPEFQVTWTYEVCQRNAIERGLVNCNDDDIIIISDSDEIPNPKKISEVMDLPGIKSLDMTFCTYFLNCINIGYGTWKKGSKVLSYKDFKSYFDDKPYRYNIYCPEKYNQGSTATKVRMYDYAQHFDNGGWHFHSLGTAKSLMAKYRAYAHIKRNKDLTDEELLAKLNNQIAGIVDSKDFMITAIDNNLPQYVLDNKEKYKDFFYPPNFKQLVRYYAYSTISGFKLAVGAFIKKFIFSKTKDCYYHHITILGLKLKFDRVSAIKLQKKLTKQIEEIQSNKEYQENSKEFWQLFMSEDFDTKFFELSKNLDSNGKKRLKTSMALMLSNYARMHNLFINNDDRMELDIIKEYEQHNYSENEGDFNFKGFKFVDGDYEPAKFLYELGLSSVKNFDKAKNILEIGAQSGDSTLILASKTEGTLFVLNPSDKLKSNVALNNIQNVKYIDSIENLPDVGLIRLNTTIAGFGDDILNLIQQFQPALLIEFEENIEEIYETKSRLDNLDLGYCYTLTKGNPKNSSGETILVAQK